MTDSMIQGHDAALLAEVLEGLGDDPKHLPPKLFYDAVGSALFERITALPEYYLTRAEAEIFAVYGRDIARAVAPDAGPVVIVEPGCGSGTKALALLRHLDDATWVGIDISPEALAAGAEQIRRAVPARVVSVVADYTRGWELPTLAAGPRVGFFPGSTIGNFEPDEAVAFLTDLAGRMGPGGRMVVGVDRWKDPRVLREAYDDAQGVTAAFNRNALAHLNHRFGADFVPERFDHRARVDERHRRVEIYLVSRGAQEARLGDRVVRFADGEAVHTENCYKFADAGFHALAARAGLAPVGTWTDAEGRFALHAYQAAEKGS